MTSTNFELKTGGCVNKPEDESKNQVLRCSAELALPLLLTDALPPSPDLEPGFGLGVQAVKNGGGFPEELTTSDLPNQSTGEIRFRRRLQTILLGRPEGFNLRMMSFNIHRFYGNNLNGPFAKVSTQDIGNFLHEKGADIIAIQEGWDEAQVKSILAALNLRRKAEGKSVMMAHGPGDFEQSWHWAITGFTGSFLAGEDPYATHGGLWIFSPFESAQVDHHIFTPTEACRGDDCFKAKGVQWVRLLLNTPNTTNTFCRQTVNWASTQVEIPARCPLPPSGDHYIDVFNTHLQAENPPLCKFQEYSKKFFDYFLGQLNNHLVGAAEEAYDAFGVLGENDWNCFTRTNAGVRTQQLQEMNAFIEKVTATKKDRPVVIMGDFNLDGKDLTGEYANLILQLGLGPIAPQNQASPPSDIISPWQNDHGWQVIHGDVVRQHPEYGKPNAAKDPNGNDLPGQALTGTFITGEKHDDRIVSNAAWIGNYMGNERYDYILVRPPMPPDSPELKAPAWIVATNPDDQPDSVADDIWSSPWPGLSGNGSFDGPPSRLSDHKPVIANLEFVPLSYLSNYHPTWKHYWEFRVVSANLLGIDDCYKEPDPRPTIHSGRALQDGSQVWNKAHIGYECSDNISASYPKDSCTSNWVASMNQDPAVDVNHAGGADIWEIDDSLCVSDDLVKVLDNGETPFTNVVWDFNGFGLMMFPSAPSLTRWKSDWILFDNAAISRCTRSASPNMCLQTTTKELPPGKQF
jgi:hypothetical protein